MSQKIFEGPRIRRISLLARGAVGLAAAKMLAADRSVTVVSYQSGELSPSLRALFPKAQAIADPASDRYAAHLRREADCVLSAHCSVILPPAALEAVAHPFNLHPGYLPYGRGYWPTYWAIADGTPAGCTLHRMAPLVDRGEIVAQQRVPVLPTDDGEALTRRVALAEVELLRAAWPTVRSGRYPIFRPAAKGTYHDRAEGLSARRLAGTETMTARRFVDLVRAFTDVRFDGTSVRSGGREIFLRLALHEAPKKGEAAMINVFGSLMGPEELEEIRTSLEAQWIGIGPKTAAFEKNFAERAGLPGFVLLDSGSNALHLAVKLLDLPPGSDVLVPSFTWISCAHAVVLCGHRPVFCDVDLDTHNVTSKTVEAARTPKTKAVMVVHYGGLPVRVDEIAPLGLPIIEDAAHAVDSRLKGVACGGLGDVGIYSFDAVKNLAMGEGGGLTAKDPARIARAKQLRYCGIGKSGFEASASKDRWWEYNVTDFFPKMLPSDIAASIGLAQLRKLDKMQAYRKKIWEVYQKEFAGLGWLVRPQDAPADARHSYFTYCVRVPGGRRDAFAKYLYQNGVYTTLRYHPLHLNKIYGSAARLPVSEILNEEALSLPIHPALKESDVALIVEKVKGWKG